MIECVFNLTCNQCMECFFYEGSPDFELALHSVAEVRRYAKDAGWKRPQGSDICPECLAENKAAKAEARKK